MSGPNAVCLRDVTDADLPILFAQQADPDANRMAAFPPRDRDAFLAHWAKVRADPATVTKTILLDGQVVGYVGSWERDGQRLVGYWIGREYWGRGAASRGLAEFLGVVQTRPLYAHVAKHNHASIRVLEKCGFAFSAEETERLGAPDDGIEEFVYVLTGMRT